MAFLDRLHVILSFSSEIDVDQCTFYDVFLLEDSIQYIVYIDTNIYIYRCI